MNQHLSLFLLYVFISIANMGFGQPVKRLPHSVVKIAPFTRLEPDALVQVTYERIINQQLSLQLEAGHGWQRIQFGGFGPTPYTPNARLAGKQVGRIRLEGRWNLPLGKSLSFKPLLRFANPEENQIFNENYIAVDVMFKRVTVTQQDTVCYGGDCLDYVFVEAPVARSVWATHLRVGQQLSLNQRKYKYQEPRNVVKQGFVLDFYIGLGVRYMQTVALRDAPVFTVSKVQERLSLRPGNQFLFASMVAGVRIGYRF